MHPNFQNDSTVKVCSHFVNGLHHLQGLTSKFANSWIHKSLSQNLILLGVKKCTLSQYNSLRCLTLADFNTEYDLPGKVDDMQISELHQYFNEASWLFVENKGSGSKTQYWFSWKPGIH